MGNTCLRIMLIVAVFATCAASAWAERCAIFFFEYEHEDSDIPSAQEMTAMETSETILGAAYAERIFLVNTDATRDKLMATLQDAFNTYTTVDLYIQAHGGMQYFRGHFDDRIYVHDIRAFSALDYANHLRLVYVGACHGWDLTDEFLDAGAVAVIGSTTKMVNFPFYPAFIINFSQLGMTVGDATALATITPGDNFQVNGDQTITMDSEN